MALDATVIVAAQLKRKPVRWTQEGAGVVAGGSDLEIRHLTADDASVHPTLSATLETYLAEQECGRRAVLVARCRDRFAGYVTILWEADDPEFRRLQVPEISDLRVLPEFQRRGIGTALMEEVEAMAATRSQRIGLNVGLHSGYGAAQRIYVRRGYVPDGSGVVVEGVPVAEGESICLDDDPIVTLRMTKPLRVVTEW